MYCGLSTHRPEVKQEVDNVNLPLGNLNDKSLDRDEVIDVEVQIVSLYSYVVPGKNYLRCQPQKDSQKLT